ncbi:MAG: ABC transporter substrate-binding protein [Pseudomonadota bacterium]
MSELIRRLGRTALGRVAPVLRRITMLAALALVAAAPPAAAAEPPVIRLAVLKFGTVNWLTETVVAEGLDRAAGFRLEVVPLAGKAATTIAFQSGDADAIVTDWVWALGRRAAGDDLRFAPYSTALGALMTAPDAGIDGLCDLDGRRIGVVGGALDKSWLVYEALAARTCGFSLPARTETLFGAPPLMSEQLRAGRVEAVSTYWHFAARLSAGGMTRALDVVGALEALGITPAPPLVGFVWRADRQDPAVMGAFLRAIEAASARLAEDDAIWDRLRPLMRADDDAAFIALRDAYRAGIPDAWEAEDTAAAEGLYRVLVETGGEAFARGAGTWDATLFETPAAVPLAGGGDAANGG